ncbi:4-alpha-glucanotransferase [Streptococcus saliviloxodontae]|uniref:4-alpha-glucanotransferase n=1 Tax=Streptococcus saliviloxodontae TaxID=1349416 RepID=A0ABS2PIK1_9STRE|nr:4-alpha-glucanotransferase [Streptococcus saliviloxodontae]MBM7635265.1 4-alpha-glucanotransferase [Streptococcus saliviloxodontae]
MKRASGILMHITSLPGDFGIGTFGQEAYEFIDFLVETKQTYWQILPLTTTSYGDSPYQSFSAVAGNTNLIDFAKLVEAGYLSQSDLEGVTFSHRDDQVDYALLFETRRPILEKAVANFLASTEGSQQLGAFETEQSSWLQDYAEFMSLKEHFGLKALQEWDDEKAIYRDQDSLTAYREQLAEAILYHKVTQLFFFQQWQELKAYANANGIAIIGDMPIYVSADSVEVWTQPELFKLDSAKKPVCIAGCPPDDFSDVGQLWGNPIYNWDYHAETGYKWWIYRIQESFKLYDYLRIDHFKGFSDFWEIPAGEETAKNGKWVSGPGIALFDAIKSELGELPIIAEDLGYVDDKAKKLLADAAFPGMKILEFGFYDVTGHSIDIPHVYTQNSVAYVGTHDNEVANGWYENLDKEQQDFVNAYTHRKEGESITQTMLRTLFATVSNTAIASMQDVLDLPAESRMNIPNTLGGNWSWRMTKDDLKPSQKDYLLTLTELYQRGNEDDNN